MRKPLVIDLFCGLSGWSNGLLPAGWQVVGFDIENMFSSLGEPWPDGDFQLVIQDVRTLHGSQFKTADLLVASPPCQFFSYCAMPWKRAKALAAEVRADPARLEKALELFDACFRIQREACAAAGRHIPMIVENVRGAESWVGRGRWAYGSFVLWGDVPALMPPVHKGCKIGGFRFNGSGGSFQSAAVARVDGRIADGGSFEGNASEMREGHSKSSRRKAASALIAKIPEPLARYIGQIFLPR